MAGTSDSEASDSISSKSDESMTEKGTESESASSSDYPPVVPSANKMFANPVLHRFS